jgi:PPOX class probable FMN-dependent enzyme
MITALGVVPFQFGKTARTESDLRAILMPPAPISRNKVLGRLDEHCRAIINLCPLVFLATSAPDGTCDSSPRGLHPGEIRVLDDRHLIIPEMSGNRRADSLLKVISNSHVGMLMVIPGREDCLRINGRAWVITDPEVLAASPVAAGIPKLAIGVEVDQAHIHCAKAFRRSGVWDSNRWPDKTSLPSLARILLDHAHGELGGTVEEIDASMTARYSATINAV